jgi:hypothetical protein
LKTQETKSQVPLRTRDPHRMQKCIHAVITGTNPGNYSTSRTRLRFSNKLQHTHITPLQISKDRTDALRSMHYPEVITMQLLKCGQIAAGHDHPGSAPGTD